MLVIVELGTHFHLILFDSSQGTELTPTFIVCLQVGGSRDDFLELMFSQSTLLLPHGFKSELGDDIFDTFKRMTNPPNAVF